MGNESLPKLVSSPSSRRSWTWAKIHDLCGMDYRSMALFRIMLGLTIIVDIFDRFPDLRAHYSDEGALPRFSVLQHFWNWHTFSFHMASGQTYFLGLMFCTHLVFAFGLMIGYRTRLCTITLFVLTVSLFERNMIVLHGGDVLLRLVVFWSMFLPLEKYYSLDSLLARKSPHERNNGQRVASTVHVSVGTLGLAAQLALMYICAHYHKVGKEWTVHRTAAFYALSLDYFRTPVGDFFLRLGVASPPILHFFTWGVYEWQLWGPIFMFFPFATQYFRMFAVLGFETMHGSFGSCMSLGTFTWITMTANLALIPPIFWDALFYLLRRSARYVITVRYPPGPTNEFIARCLSLILLSDASVQPCDIPMSELESGRMQSALFEKDSLFGRWASLSDQYLTTLHSHTQGVRDSRGKVVEGYSAMVAILRASPLLFWLAPIMATEKMHKFVEKTRNLWSEFREALASLDPIRTTEKQSAPTRQNHHKNWMQRQLKKGGWAASNLFAMLCLLICITWCLGNFGWTTYSTPDDLRGIGWTLGLDQHWGMFAPRPPDIDWWYVWELNLDDGRQLELFRNGGLFTFEGSELSWEKPKPFSSAFGNHRWMKLFETFNSNQARNEVRLQLGRYICREYNARHFGKNRLYNLKMWWMWEKHELDGSTTPQPKQLLWDHICFEKPNPPKAPVTPVASEPEAQHQQDDG